MSHHLMEQVERLGTPRVLVLGDLILDRYVWGDAERISQEAPVILLRESRQETRLGGAANVANMLRGLHCEVTLAGIVGADADGEAICNDLAAAGVDASGVCVDETRPTTVKVRFMGRAQYRHPHQMLRVDREVRDAISASLAESILQKLIARLDEFDCVLVSDYAKGVCTRELLQPLIAEARRRGLPLVVDPAAHGDCTAYVGATAVTPNRLETYRATGRNIQTIDDAFAAGKILCEKVGLDAAFVTIDRDGIALVRKSGEQFHLPTRIREVCDVTGAGDMVLAMIGAGIAAGVEDVDLARLANVAGGLEVEQIGVVPITRADILHDLQEHSRLKQRKVLGVDELAQVVRERQRAGQTVVLTNGCFDLLHAGHVSYLDEAAREGDCLVVAVNSDDSVRRLEKGPDRPLFPEDYRARMLAGLAAVDYVVVFEEDTPHALLQAIRPDVLVKGGTYGEDGIVGREVVLAYGGRVKAMGVTPGISTTDIVNRIREQAQILPFPVVNAPKPQLKAG